MSILDFRLCPGGAVLCEMAEDDSLIATDPVAKEFASDLENNIDRFSDELQDRMVHIVSDLPTVPTPQIQKAAKQYDGIECYAKLINRLSPIHEKILDLQSMNLDVSQKQEMISVLDAIQTATCDISDIMVPMLAKMQFTEGYIYYHYWDTSPIYSALGFLSMNLPAIISNGLVTYTVTHHSEIQSINALKNTVRFLLERDDIVRKYVITTNDIFNSIPSDTGRINGLKGLTMPELFKTLLDTETVLNLYQKCERTVSLEERIDYMKSNCVDRIQSSLSEVNRVYLDQSSRHIRWIMTESYAMLCDLAGDTIIDPKIFLNMSMRLCATVCNLFYLLTLTLFGYATSISNCMADKNAVEEHIGKIKRALLSAQ